MGWFEQRFEQMDGRQRVDCASCGRSMWFPPCKAGLYKTCGGDCAKAKRTKEREERRRQCATCGHDFFPRWAQIRCGKGLYCGQKCNVANRAALNAPDVQARAVAARKKALAEGKFQMPTGPANAQWKGGPAACYRRRVESGELARQRREYRKRSPHKFKEWAQKRDGKKLGKLPYGTIPKIGRLQKWRCAACRADISHSYHVDHITPLAKGGEHAPNNIQLLCVRCNLTKSAKDPIKFMQSLGFLL